MGSTAVHIKTRLEQKVAPGELPDFWHRSAIFFANLLSLFYDNVSERAELESHIAGVHTYGGRLVPIINLLFKGPDNLLLLQREPNPDILRYHQEELLLSLPDIEIVSHETFTHLHDASRNKPVPREAAELLARLKDHPAPWVDGFVSDRLLVEVAAAIGKQSISTLAGSKRGNNKLELYQHLEKNKLPVFDTHTAECSERVHACIKKLRKHGYQRVVVKSQIGASGIGLIHCETAADPLPEIPAYIFHEGPCLVQGWLNEDIKHVDNIRSPSVQMFLDEANLTLFDITEQFLSVESIHEGNQAFPPYLRDHPQLKEELLTQAGIAGRWLHRQGYRGTASVDFLVIDRKGEAEVRICELNARVTGATYPSMLARHFRPQGSWLMRNLKIDNPMQGYELFEALDRTGFLYRPDASEGLLPVNLNLDDHNRIIKGQFLFLAGEPEACEELLARTEQMESVEWDYGRD